MMTVAKTAKSRSKSASSRKTTAGKAPWDKENPKKSKKPKTKMTPAQKAKAKTRAEKAGRPYPNLVDNMAVTKIADKSSKKGK